MVSSVFSPLGLGSLSLWLAALAVAQEQNVQFNQVVNINGDMLLNTIKFPDGSKIETFSQTQQQLIANQNPNPLSASHVVGSTGQPFVQLSKNSLNIQTNRAIDLVGGQIELPIDPALLAQNKVSPDNTFVAMLSSDRQAWIVQEDIKAVNTTDNTVRMVKLNKIDGEFMVVGRQTVETSVVLTPFGQGANSQVKIEGGGIQEAEFTDGFRISVRTNQPMTLTTDVVNGINVGQLTGGVQAINNFRYLVTTNLAGLSPDLNNMVAVVQLPLNPERLMAMATSLGIQANEAINVGVAQRGVQFQPNVAGNFGAVGKRQENNNNNNRQQGGNNRGNGQQQNNSQQDNQQQNGDRNNNQNNQNNNLLNNAVLLNPTFAQVNQVVQLDQRNMRIAVPVGSLDGEFILTVTRGGAAPAGGAVVSNPAAAQPVAVPAASAPAAAQPAAPAPAAPAPAAPAPAAPAPAAPAPAASQPAAVVAPAASVPAAAVPVAAPKPMGTIGADGSVPQMGLSTMPMADIGKVPPAEAVTKRQENTANLGSVSVSMATLAAMVERKKTGTSGSAPLAVWTLMTSFAQAGGATTRAAGFPSEPAPALTQTLQRRRSEGGLVGKRFVA